MFNRYLMKNVKVDGVRLLALAGDDRDFLTTLVCDFKMDAMVLIDEMETFGFKEANDEVMKRLHQLKGSSGSIGMKSIYVCCLEMELWGEKEWAEFGGWVEFRDHLSEAVDEALILLAG